MLGARRTVLCDPYLKAAIGMVREDGKGASGLLVVTLGVETEERLMIVWICREGTSSLSPTGSPGHANTPPAAGGARAYDQ